MLPGRLKHSANRQVIAWVKGAVVVGIHLIALLLPLVAVPYIIDTAAVLVVYFKTAIGIWQGAGGIAIGKAYLVVVAAHGVIGGIVGTEVKIAGNQHGQAGSQRIDHAAQQGSTLPAGLFAAMVEMGIEHQ